MDKTFQFDFQLQITMLFGKAHNLFETLRLGQISRLRAGVRRCLRCHSRCILRGTKCGCLRSPRTCMGMGAGYASASLSTNASASASASASLRA